MIEVFIDNDYVKKVWVKCTKPLKESYYELIDEEFSKEHDFLKEMSFKLVDFPPIDWLVNREKQIIEEIASLTKKLNTERQGVLQSIYKINALEYIEITHILQEDDENEEVEYSDEQQVHDALFYRDKVLFVPNKYKFIKGIYTYKDGVYYSFDDDYKLIGKTMDGKFTPYSIEDFRTEFK